MICTYLLANDLLVARMLQRRVILAAMVPGMIIRVPRGMTFLPPAAPQKEAGK